MNEQQNMVVATAVSGLILVVVFLCPWRIESSNELQWSPIYQPPMSYERIYDDDYGQQGGSQINAEEAEIAVGILLLEVLALLTASGLLYVFYSDSSKQDTIS
jgi:hypothetical protein